MFIKKDIPLEGHNVELKEGLTIYTKNGKFIGPHTFTVVEISDSNWIVKDLYGNEASGCIWDEDLWIESNPEDGFKV